MLAGEAQSRWNSAYEGTTGAAALAINQSLNLQDVERMTDGHAGDAELLNKFAFGGESLAGFENFGFDPAAQGIRDGQISRPAAGGFSHSSQILPTSQKIACRGAVTSTTSMVTSFIFLTPAQYVGEHESQ